MFVLTVKCIYCLLNLINYLQVLVWGDLRGNLELFPLVKDWLLGTSVASAVISTLSYFKGHVAYQAFAAFQWLASVAVKLKHARYRSNPTFGLYKRVTNVAFSYFFL